MTQHEDIAEVSSRIRQAANFLDEHAALIMNTALQTNDRDGFPTGHTKTAAEGDDSDVTLTGVESAVIQRQGSHIDRFQSEAIAVVHMQHLAKRLMTRAEHYASILHNRIPQERRDIAAVTCVNQGCERLRSEGWDDNHPNGATGRCRSCYERRTCERKHG